MDIPLRLVPGQGPRYAQVRAGLQDLIARGVLKPGAALPPLRLLARQLGVSQFTALHAYRELQAMGYLETEIGIGSYVSKRLPETFLKAIPAGPMSPDAALPPRLLETLPAGQGPFMTSSLNRGPVFRAYAGDARLFSAGVWRRLWARHLRSKDLDWTLHNFNNPGSGVLRAALADQVLPARGIRAAPEEILVCASGAQAIQTFLGMVLRKGDGVVLEDPGWIRAQDAVQSLGCRSLPVEVDPQGIPLDGLERAIKDRRVRAAFLTPSHQFPTGATLDYGRRQRLLELASGRPLWILEDDYDHEFHYDSPPLPSLKSMDRTGQVVYFGTFSKSMFQSIQLAFLVAHREVVRKLYRHARLHAQRLTQQVMADFIREGHYAHHIRRTRRIYHRRRDALVQALGKKLPDFRFEVPKGGIRLWVACPPDIDPKQIWNRMSASGVFIHNPSMMGGTEPRGSTRHLLLGFASVNEEEIRKGVEVMAQAVRAMRRGKRRAGARES